MTSFAAPFAAHRLSVAPMMDCTDRHYRMLARQCTRHTLLYTEMVTARAVIHGDREHLIGFHADERPLALQLGGSEPEDMGRAAAYGAQFGYDEVNINVGCPSDRVQAGRFGACLMKEPERVAECVAAMRAASAVPVTVKCRIGVDELDSFEHLTHFVSTVAAAGCERFAIHARNAWLQGLSPKQNREVPPLRYDVVARLRDCFPALTVLLNGGIQALDEAERHLQSFDGVMIGRAAYRNPYLLAEADHRIFGRPTLIRSRHEVVRRLLPYIDRQLTRGTRLSAITRHLVGLFQGQPGAKRWRRYISEHAHRPGAGTEVLERALEVTMPGSQTSPPPRQASKASG